MPQATASILMLLSICLLAAASVVFWLAMKNSRAASASTEDKTDPPIIDPEIERRRDVARFLFRLRVSTMEQPKSRKKIDSDVENN